MTLNLLEIKHIVDGHLGSSQLHKKNGEISYYCPFCNHYKRKLQVNVYTQKWHCWTCNERGLTIGSLLKKSGADMSICQKVRSIYGDTNINYNQGPGRVIVNLPEQYRPLSLDRNTPDYRNALHYATQVRKLTITDIVRYEIGYCEEGPYAGMLIIPSYSEANTLNYYVARSYYDTKFIHKTPPVSKDIIGFENQINWSIPVTIVEGAFDAIATKRNAVPLFGKIMPYVLRNKIVTHSKKIYIALDNDAFKSSVKEIEYFMNNGIEVYYVALPGKDPSELGYENMVKCINSAGPVDFFKLMTLKLSI